MADARLRTSLLSEDPVRAIDLATLRSSLLSEDPVSTIGLLPDVQAAPAVGGIDEKLQSLLLQDDPISALDTITKNTAISPEVLGLGGLGAPGLQASENSPIGIVEKGLAQIPASPQEKDAAVDAAVSLTQVQSAGVDLQNRGATEEEAIQLLLQKGDAKTKQSIELLDKINTNQPLSKGELLVMLTAQLLTIGAGAAIGGRKGALAGLKAGSEGGLAGLKIREAGLKEKRDDARTKAATLREEGRELRLEGRQRTRDLLGREFQAEQRSLDRQQRAKQAAASLAISQANLELGRKRVELEERRLEESLKQNEAALAFKREQLQSERGEERRKRQQGLRDFRRKKLFENRLREQRDRNKGKDVTDFDKKEKLAAINRVVQIDDMIQFIDKTFGKGNDLDQNVVQTALRIAKEKFPGTEEQQFAARKAALVNSLTGAEVKGVASDKDVDRMFRALFAGNLASLSDTRRALRARLDRSLKEGQVLAEVLDNPTFLDKRIFRSPESVRRGAGLIPLELPEEAIGTTNEAINVFGSALDNL